MRAWMLLAAVVPLAGASALLPARAQDAPRTIAWRTDLAAAREEAREADKPLLVVFRCPP